MSWTFEDAPDWLKEQIKGELVTESLAWVMGKDIRKGMATHSEICLALYLASLNAPLNHNATEIYLYLSTALMTARGVDVPEDIRVTKLNIDQVRELEEYRRTLYRKRGHARSAMSDALTEVFGKPRKQSQKPAMTAPATSGQQCLMISFDDPVLQQIKG
jgi:hypothetical protein